MTLREQLEKSASMLPPRASAITGYPPNVWITASTTEQGQSADEVSTAETGYTLKKTFYIYRSGALRLIFQAKKSAGSDVSAQFRSWDGVTETTLGTETVSETDYTSHDIDLTVKAGDLIRAYIKGVGGNTAYLKEMKVCFDLNKTTIDYELILE